MATVLEVPLINATPVPVHGSNRNRLPLPPARTGLVLLIVKGVEGTTGEKLRVGRTCWSLLADSSPTSHKRSIPSTSTCVCPASVVTVTPRPGLAPPPPRASSALEQAAHSAFECANRNRLPSRTSVTRPALCTARFRGVRTASWGGERGVARGDDPSNMPSPSSKLGSAAWRPTCADPNTTAEALLVAVLGGAAPREN